MSTNVGKTDDEQLAINLRHIISVIDSGHWKVEDVIKKNQDEIAFWSNKKCRKSIQADNRDRRIAYITRETLALIQHYKDRKP